MLIQLYNIYVAVSFRRLAITVNAIASLERFLAITLHLTAASTFLRRLPVVVIVVVVVVATLVSHGYFFLEFQVVPFQIPGRFANG
jgi:hypothetical protein